MKNIFYILIILLGISINSNSQTWSQIGQNINGINEYDNLGYSVSLSDDGTVLAIGAPAINGTSNIGKVSVYKNNLGTWQQIGEDIIGETTGDNSGVSVSLSSDGNILAIGASDNSGYANEAGHVRIFRNNSGTWEQIGDDIDGEAADNYSGYSVSLSADGETVAIGATGNNDNGNMTGQVRVYNYNLETWQQIGSDIDGDENYSDFGFSVSLSADASVVAIGIPHGDGSRGFNRGETKIFKNNLGTWQQVGQTLEGEAGSDYFGHSVSISQDGNIVAIGAHYNDGAGTDAGHVRVFRNNLGTWEQIGNDIDGELEDDLSGHSVCINNDGSIVAIGAIQNEDNGLNTGHVRVFENNDDAWVQLGQDVDGEAIGEVSGFSVSLNSDASVLAIGAIQNDELNTDAGQVKVYELISASISKINKGQLLVYPNPANEFISINKGIGSFTNAKYKVSDISGKTIVELSNLQENVTINISSLEKGIYFLSIYTSEKMFSEKIIKN